MTIATNFQGEIVSVDPESSIFEAVKIMHQHAVADILVLRDDRLVGILNQQDIKINLAANADKITVSDILQEKLHALAGMSS